MTAVWLALKHWKLAVALAGALYIGWLHFQIAHLQASIERYVADVEILNERIKTAQKAVAEAKRVNDGNVAALDRAQADQAEIVRALERELAAVKDQKQREKIVKQVIRERIEVCPPMAVPPGIGAAVDGLRSRQGAAADRPDRDSVRPAPSP